MKVDPTKLFADTARNCAGVLEKLNTLPPFPEEDWLKVLRAWERGGLLGLGFNPDGSTRSWMNVCTHQIVVAHPTHILRAFVNTVTEAVRCDSAVKVYAIPGFTEPWQKTTLYSQHGEHKRRIDCLEGELERLNMWYAKGDLVSATEVLEYVANRDVASIPPQFAG